MLKKQYSNGFSRLNETLFPWQTKSWLITKQLHPMIAKVAHAETFTNYL